MLAVLLLLSTASADCMSGMLTVWPQAGASVPSTSQVMLQAYGTDRPLLKKLGKGDAALVQGNQRIDLDVREALHGSFMDDQLVLVPERAPDAGLWTLEVNGAPLELWTGQAREAVAWTFQRGAPEPPTWAGKPSIVEQDRQFFGCGPGVSVVVDVPTRDTIWVQATIASGDEKGTTVRLPVQEGRITIGHGMCAGLIELEADKRYTATLVPVGADGQRAKVPQTLTFIAP